VNLDEDEIFAEDLQLAQDRSRRHKNKKNKNGKKSGNSADSRNKSEQHKKDLAKQKEKHGDRDSSFNSARHKMQEALNNELAKVYYEEFLEKNNAVEYNYDDYYYDEPDYYYYYYDYE